MDIKITYNGKEQTIEDVDIGAQIQVEYFTEGEIAFNERKLGEHFVYCLKITNKKRAVLN